MHFPVFGYIIVTFDYSTQRQVLHILGLNDSYPLKGKRSYDLSGKASGHPALQFYNATTCVSSC